MAPAAPTGGPTGSAGVGTVGTHTAAPTTAPAPADCTPADLDPRPYYGGGVAAGSSYTYVVVRNTSDHGCWLRGLPKLVGTDGHATAQTRIQVVASGDVADHLVAPGAYAQTGLHTANGNPYGPARPSAPTRWTTTTSRCSCRPDPFPLLDFRVSKECGPISETSWQVSTFPDPGWENTRRAPGALSAPAGPRRMTTPERQRGRASATPLLASASARSLPGSPACPLTHSHSISCRAHAAASRCHRSAFFTGCFAAVRHPLRCQPASHWVMPLRTYRLSVCRRTTAGG